MHLSYEFKKIYKNKVFWFTVMSLIILNIFVKVRRFSEEQLNFFALGILTSSKQICYTVCNDKLDWSWVLWQLAREFISSAICGV